MARHGDDDDDARRARQEPAGAAEQSRPADRPPRLRARPLRGLRLRRSHEPRGRSLRPAVRRHLHPHAVERRPHHRRPVRRSVSARREGHLRPRQPEPRRPRRHLRARAAPPAKDVFTGFNVFSIALEVPISGHLPARHSAQRPAQAELDRQPAARLVAASAAGRRRPSIRTQRHHRAQGLGRVRAGGPQRAAALQRRPRRHAAPDPLPAQQPDARRDQLRRRRAVPGAGARRRGARDLQGARRARRRR